MNPSTPSTPGEPIYFSVRTAARMLGVTLWEATQLLNQRRIESRWLGPRRLVRADSLEAFADTLPSERA